MNRKIKRKLFKTFKVPTHSDKMLLKANVFMNLKGEYRDTTQLDTRTGWASEKHKEEFYLAENRNV